MEEVSVTKYWHITCFVFNRNFNNIFWVLLHVFMEFLSTPFTFILFVSFFHYIMFFFCCGPRIGDKVMILIIVEIQ
jgi:hypothetical protein